MKFKLEFNPLKYQEALVIDVPNYAVVKCHIKEEYIEGRRVDRLEPGLYRLIPKRNRMATSWVLEFPFEDNVQIILGDDLHSHLIWHVTIYFRGHHVEMNLPEFNPRYKLVSPVNLKSLDITHPTRFEREPVI